MAYQVAVFMENKPGRLEKMTEVLEDASISIRAITLTTTAQGWGILNLLVDQPERAVELLRQSNHSAALRRIVVVEVEDRPGGLRKVLSLLAAGGLNVENAYGSVLDKGRRAVLVIDVEKVEQAATLLARAGVKLVEEREIYAL
jgi:hypothetical protein